MGKPSILDERGVPRAGVRIRLPVMRPYREPQVGVVTRSGECDTDWIPKYVFVKLERDGEPRMKLYCEMWHRVELIK